MITAQMATIPERLPILSKAINSIGKQVDSVRLILNDFSEDDLIKVSKDSLLWDFDTYLIRRQNQLTDAEKYYGVENLDGYVFTCDDDLEYPDGYVKYMIEKIEEYKRRAVISFHGSIFSQRRPFESYYGWRLWSFRCLEDQTDDIEVDVVGNGCAAFHTDTLKISYSDFKLRDCSDLQFSLIAKKQNVKRIVVAHKALINLKPELYGETIWDRNYGKDEKQVELLNKYWD